MKYRKYWWQRWRKIKPTDSELMKTIDEILDRDSNGNSHKNKETT
jgi:hypothetical protein